MEVLAIAFVLYLLGDTVTRGKLGAVARGTTKGVAKTGARAAREGTARAARDYRAFLASDAAPLHRTRRGARAVARPTARGIRAGWGGARAGVAEELARLQEQIERARAEAARALEEAQDPALGVQRGRGGRSFDLPPRGSSRAPEQHSGSTPAPAPAPAAPDPEVAVTGVQPRTEAETWQDPQPLRAPDGTLITACEVAGAGVYGDPDGACAPPTDPAAGRPRPLATRPYPRAYDGRLLDPGDPGFNDAPARPRGGTQQEENPMTMNGSAPAVQVESLPAWMAACDQLAKLGQQVHEAGIQIGVSAPAQCGLQDAIDILRTVARNAQTTYQPLVEAADAAPRGVEAVTIAQARTQ